MSAQDTHPTGPPDHTSDWRPRLLAYMDIFRVVSILALLVAPLPFLFEKTAVRRRPPAEH
jgi:hypothetical protein